MNARENIINKNVSKCKHYFTHLTEKERNFVVEVTSKRNISYTDFNRLQDIAQTLELKPF